MNEALYDQTDAAAAIDELLSEFSRKPAGERAFILLRNWFDAAERRSIAGESLPGELSAELQSWLDDPHTLPARNEALDRLIEMTENNCQEYLLPG